MWQKMKKIIRVGLLLMLLTVIATPVQTNAAESLKLNKSSMTLCTGRAYRLKVNTTETVKWSSVKSSVAVVDTAGKITAKTPGTTYIIAQCGKGKVKCKVVVKDHEWKRTASRSATCSAKGYKKYQCTRCETVKTITIPVLKHKWVTQNTTIHHAEKGYYETTLVYKKVRSVICACGIKIYDTELQPIKDHVELPMWEDDNGKKHAHSYPWFCEDQIPEVKKVWRVISHAYDEVVKETVCSFCGKKK